MEDGLLVRGGKRDPKPLLLKLGFALALSIAGYFASQFTSKRPPKPKPKPKSSKGDDGVKESPPARSLKDQVHIISSEETLAKIIHADTTEEDFLMPDFNKAVLIDGFEEQSEKNGEKLAIESEERVEMEKEIAYLRNLVEALKERERSLEMQMIEYYGLKEQLDSFRELENRLKVNAMESKLLNLKLESLQADNQKLQAQLSDYPRAVSELEAAREEIKRLKSKLKLDGELTKEKLAELHRRITDMVDRERKRGEDDIEVEKKLKRLKELEDEVAVLRDVNARLAEENLKFVQMLEAAKMAASSDSDRREVQALEESSHRREENEELIQLKEEIEQLQTDRCADVEELVYLRWVNACLRYELRNYQPPPGKTAARDLSKCLSPESERKAKRLILEYANDRNNISLYDFDTESCSSSQASSEECTDSSFVVSSSTKNSSSSKKPSSKLVSKLKKLVLGKDSKRNKGESTDGAHTSIRRASITPCEDVNAGRNSFESVSSSCISVENTSTDNWHSKPAPSQRPPRPSLDVQRVRGLELESEESVAERSRSDLGTTFGHARMVSEGAYSHSSVEHVDGPEKVRLKKFADVLRGPLKSRRKAGIIS